MQPLLLIGAALSIRHASAQVAAVPEAVFALSKILDSSTSSKSMYL